MQKKWVGALVALGMMGAAATPAQADVTVEGCYGAVVVACDPTVNTTYDVTVGDEQYPVCVGTCTYVPGPGLDTSGGLYDGNCASYSTLSGDDKSVCVAVYRGDSGHGACYQQQGVYWIDPLNEVCTPDVP